MKKSKELNKINNTKTEEKFKILPEKVKPKTTGNEKNQILRGLEIKCQRSYR